MSSLRARKKAETRQRIADVATTMFVARGFDNVSVAEIAEAADVSKVTVFNYFPRKEDIFFDRGPQAQELITAAVRDRAPDETPIQAMRRLFVRQAEEGHPLGGFQDRFIAFWNTVRASAALRARAREGLDELRACLATVIAETSDDPAPDVTAAVVMGAFQAVFAQGIARMADGGTAAEVTADHIVAVGRAFDRLAAGMS